MTRETKFAETRLGRIAYHEVPGPGPVLLFIHGNSSAKEIFHQQLDDIQLALYRRIAIDLPGHGESGDAANPDETYTVHGFGDAAMAFLDAMQIRHAAIFGWSLGGHVALELMGRWSGTFAVWISGTPPLSNNPAELSAGFQQRPEGAHTFNGNRTAADSEFHARAAIGPGCEFAPWMLQAALRTDPRFPPAMLKSAMAGQDLDEKALVANSPVPLAIDVGADDPFISIPYLQQLSCRSLWTGKVLIHPGLQHAPFYQAPARINLLLASFLAYVSGERRPSVAAGAGD